METIIQEPGIIRLNEFGKSSDAKIFSLIFLDYRNAIENKDYERLKWYRQFGPTVRHKVRNVFMYQRNLKYGYDDKSLNAYNWIDPAKLEVEIVSLKTKYDNNAFTYLQIGKGLNGKFTWGYNLDCGGEGTSKGCHTVADPLNTREEALILALDHAFKWFESRQASNDPYHNKNIINGVLKQLKELMTEKVQLALF